MIKFMFSQNAKVFDEIFQLLRQRKTGRFCQIIVNFFENLNFDILSIPVLKIEVGEGPLTPSSAGPAVGPRRFASSSQ